MSLLSYPNVAPLVVSVQIEGSTAHVVFRCRRSGIEVESTATIEPKMGRQESASILNKIQDIVFPILGRQIESETAVLPTREAFVLCAFEQVRGRFVWDLMLREYTAREVVAELDFERQRRLFPVESSTDQAVLAHMLAEMARADEHICDEERSFSERVNNYGVGIDSLLLSAPVSLREMQRATVASRETILMLCMALAYIDQDYSRDERSKMNAYRVGLGVSRERAEELDCWAQEYVYDRLVGVVYDEEGILPVSESRVHELAQNFDLPDEILRRVDVRHARRLEVGVR